MLNIQQRFRLLADGIPDLTDTLFFDLNGKAIDKTQYAQNATDREKTIGMKLGNGYNVDPPAWKDPIKLRKKRIEQWKQMRSHYSPDSLPSKIETPLPKNP